MITFGTDPEVFFKRDGSVLPAGVVFQDTIETEYGKLYVDGAALEYQPRATVYVADLCGNLSGLMSYALTQLTRPDDVDIEIAPELPIDLAWCEKDPQLAVFGCDPDQSVWGEECRPATIDASKHPWRYAGCHLHFGNTENPLWFLENGRIESICRAFDRTVGLMSMWLSDNQDSRRRGIYGRPGVYRIQPWGLEYRTPSNCILRSPSVFSTVLETAAQVISLVDDDEYEEMKRVLPDDLVVGTLRSNDVTLAGTLYQMTASIFGLPALPERPSEDWKSLWQL